MSGDVERLAEFDTPAEEILAVIKRGEAVTFGIPGRMTITHSTWPIFEPTTTIGGRDE